MPATADQSGHGLDRRFLKLLGVSIALHAAVLAWVHGPLRHPPAGVAVLLASLRPAMSGSSEPVAAVRAAPAAATPPQAVRESRLARDPQPVRTAVLAAAPIASPGPEVVSAPVSQRPVAEEAVAVPPVIPSPSRPALDQNRLLERYGSRLSGLFASHQEYPRLAALRGWEGEVRLRLRVARKGSLVAVQLERSSGYEVLDQHALAMVEQLRSLPPLPDDLEAGEVQVVVPVNYRLKNPA